jgi:hypothetical protein
MASPGDDEDIPELVEAPAPSAVNTEPSTSRHKSDSIQKVPITIVTGLSKSFKVEDTLLTDQDISAPAKQLSSTISSRSNTESE